MLSPIVLVCLLPLLNGLPVAVPKQKDVSNPMTASKWTDESLCVFKMGSSCPSGFTQSQIILSVKPDVNPADKGENGELLIAMGKAGESSLTRNPYDAVYTLKLIMCCKSKE